MEQATIDTSFARCKHYYQSLLNIKQACFTALDASINVAFQVSNDPAVQGWHAGMSTLVILNQLFKLYGHPTPVILEQNNKIFCSPWLPIPGSPLQANPGLCRNCTSWLQSVHGLPAHQ
jgi:hypothetical protein